MRKIWWFSPIRAQALKQAKQGKEYMCAKCHALFASKKEVEVDHIKPVKDFQSHPSDWNGMAQGLFYSGENNLQVLCKRCHKSKTLG